MSKKKIKGMIKVSQKEITLLLSAFDFKVVKGIVIDKKGKPILCQSCSKKIHINKYGIIIIPSNKDNYAFYCDSELCVATAFEEHNLDDIEIIGGKNE